jgi:hypothetical protein
MLAGLFALSFAAFGAIGEIRSHGALHRRGVTTNAVIVDVLTRERSGRAADIMIEFTTDHGVVREPLSVSGTSVAGLEAGHVLVTYDRANPATVKTADAARSLDLWSQVPPLAFGVLSGGFFVVTLAAHFEQVKRRRGHHPDPRVAG